MKPGDARGPRIVGHRGAAARAPENTASSFRAGIAAGADAIELDVGLSAEGRVVVLHDATLERTTDGRGPLSGRSWEELSRLDAGSWFSPRFAGEPLLDLDAAFAIIRASVPVIVEIKARPGGDVHPDDFRLLDGVLASLRRTGGLANATVSSSHWPVLDVAAERAPSLALALTVPPLHREDPVAAARRIGASALHPNRRLCTRKFVESARSVGLEVIAYVVNRAAQLEPLLAVGVDGIFTDDPEAMRRLVARRFPPRSPGDER
jgi:glycerophosphoryl diester phosphodiesterase